MKNTTLKNKNVLLNNHIKYSKGFWKKSLKRYLAQKFLLSPKAYLIKFSVYFHKFEK